MKRLQSCTSAAGEESLNEPYDESLESNQSADGSLEFFDLIASVKLTINRPPLPDIIERPKSMLPAPKTSPLAVSLPYLQSSGADLTKCITGIVHSRRGSLSHSFLKLYVVLV